MRAPVRLQVASWRRNFRVVGAESRLVTSLRWRVAMGGTLRRPDLIDSSLRSRSVAGSEGRVVVHRRVVRRASTAEHRPLSIGR